MKHSLLLYTLCCISSKIWKKNKPMLDSPNPNSKMSTYFNLKISWQKLGRGSERLKTTRSFFFFFFKEFYLFLEKGRRKKGRETSMCERKKCPLVASCMPPTGDLFCNPRMCPQ